MKPGQKHLGQPLPQEFVAHEERSVPGPLEPSALRLDSLSRFDGHLGVDEVDPQVTPGHPGPRRHRGDPLPEVRSRLGSRPHVPRVTDGGPSKGLKHVGDVLVGDQLVRRPLDVRHLVGREVVDAPDVVERRAGRDLVQKCFDLTFHLLEAELRPLLVQHGPVAVEPNVGDVARIVDLGDVGAKGRDGRDAFGDTDATSGEVFDLAALQDHAVA